MKTIRIASILIGIVIFGTSGISVASIPDAEVKEALGRLFSPECDVFKQHFILHSEEYGQLLKILGRGSASRTFNCYIGVKNGSINGFATIRKIRTTKNPMTIMIGVDLDLSIRAVEILKYKGTYAARTQSKTFKDQFLGKTVQNPIQLNSDIDSISGATISCAAITQNVRSFLAYLNAIVPNRNDMIARLKNQSPYIKRHHSVEEIRPTGSLL